MSRNPRRIRNFAILLQVIMAICPLVIPALAAPPSQPPHGEIIWDTYGIPHVFAKNAVGLFYAFGYAQAKAHGNLLLQLYGEARARAAEYWGAKYEESDRYLIANGVWPRAQEWYREQAPQMKANLDAFAAGINAYGAEHPDSLSADAKEVLPISGVDVIAHWERVMEYLYIASPTKVYGASQRMAELGLPQFPGSEPQDEAGSNGWAVAPSKSADGHAMLLSNPHLAWAPSYMTYFEAHLTAPGIDMYGATQVGFPVLRFCFNQDHGLTNTVNPITAETVYKLKLSGDGYLFDGKVLPFDSSTQTFKVKQADGSLKEETVAMRRAVQGPVFTRPDGTTVALRVAGLDRPFGIQEYWDLDNAHSLDAVISVLKRLQVPMFNMVYADKDGHILYQYNGMVPVRSHGDFAYWSGLVPGDTSDTLWTKIHPYEDLPRTLDPPEGWVQNTNNPPWTNTETVLDPKKYPAYFSPITMSLRSEQSGLLLMSKPKLTFDDFMQLKMCTRSLLADRILPPLLKAAADNHDPLVQQAVALLKQWNHRYDNDSRAALLFEEWAKLFMGPQFSNEENFAQPWTLTNPFQTPNGLKDPAHAAAMLGKAAQNTIAKYGSIDRPFGDVSRFHLDDTDVPGNGGFGNIGIFRVITWSPLKPDGERNPIHGETYISMIEFSKPMKAMGLTTYGESSQPGSKHSGDQLQLLSDEKLRPLWLTRTEIEQHMEEKKAF
jgi:acyl-homoserine-lactone acylase